MGILLCNWSQKHGCSSRLCKAQVLPGYTFQNMDRGEIPAARFRMACLCHPSL
jgi:hypothetical protein